MARVLDNVTRAPSFRARKVLLCMVVAPSGGKTNVLQTNRIISAVKLDSDAGTCPFHIMPLLSRGDKAVICHLCCWKTPTLPRPNPVEAWGQCHEVPTMKRDVLPM